MNKDFRKKANLKWLNDNYFISIYDINDNFIGSCGTIELSSKLFNIETKKILERIRNNQYIEFQNGLYKLFFVKKDKELKNLIYEEEINYGKSRF